MAKLFISDQEIKSSHIEVNPYVDGTTHQMTFESIFVTFTEVPVNINPNGYYSGHVEGENPQTGKKEQHMFNGYKVADLNDSSILLIHPEFFYKYELEMSIAPKE